MKRIHMNTRRDDGTSREKEKGYFLSGRVIVRILDRSRVERRVGERILVRMVVRRLVDGCGGSRAPVRRAGPHFAGGRRVVVGVVDRTVLAHVGRVRLRHLGRQSRRDGRQLGSGHNRRDGGDGTGRRHGRPAIERVLR